MSAGPVPPDLVDTLMYLEGKGDPVLSDNQRYVFRTLASDMYRRGWEDGSRAQKLWMSADRSTDRDTVG